MAESKWDERDKFQEDAIAIIERYHKKPFKDAYSITGQIYDDLVRPLKQHGDEPLQLLLAASMLVQRFKDMRSGYFRCKRQTAKCVDVANDIDGILLEFATDSKGSTNQIERK